MIHSDNTLMTEVRGGRVAKLAVLFERHHSGLFRYFVSMTQNPEIAEDLVQDVFFRILRFRETYDPEKSFTAWMYQIARNVNMDRLRQRRGEVIGIDAFTATEAEPVSHAPDPEASAANQQNLRLLGRALDLLPEDKREILMFSRFQGLKYEEIADVLGCEIGTVKTRVYRAMRALEEIYFQLAGVKAS